MKAFAKSIAVQAMSLVLLASCQQAPDDSIESRSLVQLRVKATTVKQEIQGWESAGDGDLTMNGVEAKSRAEQESASRMAFFLLGEDGEKVLSQEKASDSGDYLSLYAEVPKGSYQLVAFGHNGSADVTINADAVVEPDGKLTDSFVYYKEIELNEESEAEQSITLDRCVAKFSLKHTDAIPSDAASVEFVITGAGKVVNAKTGLADEAEDQTVEITIPTTAVGTKNNSFSFYVFLTSEESSLKITATSKDADGNTLTSYTFEDVAMEVNMQTIYSGAFFHSDQTISASFNTEWKASNEVNF